MASPTPKNLVIVESPAKATTISRFLGKNYRVEASYGHVRDLPQNAKEIPAAVRKQSWARLGVNLDEGFEPVYVVPADKKRHVQRLKDALKGADHLLLATDEDREGESISWHVLELLKPKKGTEVSRIVFHEVTPEAIKEALRSPRQLDENLVRAQEARRVLDRLYGYTLSPLLWKRVAPGLSAGRVQSVAVRLLVERERERKRFRAAEYWDIKATLAAEGGGFDARLVRVGGERIAEGKSFDPETGALGDARRKVLLGDEARQLAGEAEANRPWTVTSVDRSPGTQRPYPPFITSTLQQEGNRKLRFTARRTMSVAQQLYEGIDLGGERVGLITYMRTDSLTLSERALAQARKVIGVVYGEDYLPDKPVRYRTKSKGAQEAHEAIRPTDLARRPQDVRRYLDDDQFRLYELVWKRTIASQMLPARVERTSVEVEVASSGGPLTFAASGKRIVFPGFLRAYVEGSDDPESELGDQETLLPPLDEGQALEPTAVEAEGHETKPPYRYTEASLVKKLEEEGIGRPSTYASILGTVQERGYVFKRGNELVPTFTAFAVTELLEKQFEDLVDTGFTATMENDLDEVAAGRKGWDILLGAFFHGDGGDHGLQQRVEEGEVFYPSIALGADPDSGEPLEVKVGRYGPYVRRGADGPIASLPEDLPPADLTPELAAEMLRGKEQEAEPVTEDPATGLPVYLRHGRFGFYLEREPAAGEADAKPRRVSLPKEVSSDDLTPEIAQALIQLPRELGTDPETGEEIAAGLGRYGPFVRRGKDFRNLPSWRAACDISLDEALELVRQPKARRGRGRAAASAKTVLKELGELADAAGPVQVLDGRYGPYVTDGKTNATLPKGTDPQSVTPDQARELLDAKRKAPSKGRRRTTTTRRKK
ncbi:MAG TPA: type I DNA topoisomerase [Thermoanaerobaculia bacterium]|nr:type I DNA topoisomerase [Thermoanaerobaculia bacterium]